MTIGAPVRILNIAHRGVRAFAPENTLVAFAKAKTFGCEMFEMDIRLTKDGEIVVHHDEDLTRCTDVKTRFPSRSSYNLDDFTFKEIGQLDAGGWYVEQLKLPSGERQPFLQSLSDTEIAEYVSLPQQKYYSSGDIKIPSLAETLCLAKELDLMVNIEIKVQCKDSLGLVSALLGAVKAMAMEEQIIITSFEHDWLKQVRLQTKKIATGALTGTPIHAPVSYLRKLKANAYNLGCYADYQADRFNGKGGRDYLAHIGKIRKAGIDVNIWTCNNQEEMGHLFAAGITGIISDYPNRVREQLARFEKN
jgi:glycerophosphoryl diester phosphodiesterase